MPKPRKPPRTSLHLRQLALLGTPKDLDRRIREHAHILEIAPNSPAAEDIARLAVGWIVRYWAWRTRELAAPSAAEEALLLEDILRRMDKAVEECGLSFDTDRALMGCAQTLKHRIGVLRSAPTPTGPKRDRALQNLAPELMSELEDRLPHCGPRLRKRFVMEVLRTAGIVGHDDHHTERVPVRRPRMAPR